MAHSDSHCPAYYRRGNIQTWDFIRDQGLNFHLGNAIKYICRAGFKDSKVEDLKKAIHYLQNELENENENEIASQPTGEGVQDCIPSNKFEGTLWAEYATDFDR